jgi:hypothetical protein
MLEGVHILNELTQYTVSDGVLIGGIGCIILSIVFLVLTCMAIYYKNIGDIVVCVSFMVLVITISINCISSYNNRTSYKEYKVTIDDSVKMTEFNSKYNIISQEGKIYTITVKEKK